MQGGNAIITGLKAIPAYWRKQNNLAIFKVIAKFGS